MDLINAFKTLIIGLIARKRGETNVRKGPTNFGDPDQGNPRHDGTGKGYPNGKVTDKNDWNTLLKYYDEQTLNYRLGTKKYENMGGVQKSLYWIPQGLDQFATGMEQLFSKEALPTTPTQYAGRLVRQEAAEIGAQRDETGEVQYDENGKMIGQSLLGKAAIDAMGGGSPGLRLPSLDRGSGTLTNAQKAVLWQSYNKTWKAKAAPAPAQGQHFTIAVQGI